MATKKKSTRATAKKGAKKSAKKSAKKGARRGTAAGKVKGKLSLSKLAKVVNAMESRVDVLEKNDGANQALWLGMINSSRKRNGQGAISSLPGFAKPRLFKGGYGKRVKALASGM